MKHFVLPVLLILVLFTTASCNSMNARIDSVFEFAGQQLEKSCAEVNDTSKFPVNTEETGEWHTTSARGWTSGFFPGCLWLMYEYSGEDVWKERALAYTKGLEDIQYYDGNHDIGFMMFSSYGQGYRLTGDPSFKPILVQSGKTLETRYSDKVKSIMSWNPHNEYKFRVIVDNMMNLELLFWAARNGGSSRLADIAVKHAETTMKNHFRPDGSSYHVVNYDPETGRPTAKFTHQGYADDSCWSRGQAWGIYGFTMMYRETKRQDMLATAEKLADYFIAHLPEDYVPYWDFDRTGIAGEDRDSSAGSIAASALIELSTFASDSKKAKLYKETAVKMLDSLTSDKYLARGTNASSILLHGVASKPHGNAVDRGLIYGDYYLLEALLRLKRGIELVK